MLVVLLALPSVNRPLFIEVGNWLAIALCYLILLLALASTSTKDGGKHGVVSWLLTRPVALELGAMSFCFYAFHFVPIIYAMSIGLPPNRSAAVEYCAAVAVGVDGSCLLASLMSGSLHLCRVTFLLATADACTPGANELH